MQFKNLTPHSISIVSTDDSVMTIPPSSIVAKVIMEEWGVEPVGTGRDGALVPVIRRQPGEVNLPNPEPGTVYLVSSMVLDALKAAGSTRKDVFAPDTGATAIRFDDGPQKGQVKAVTRLVTI